MVIVLQNMSPFLVSFFILPVRSLTQSFLRIFRTQGLAFSVDEHHAVLYNKSKLKDSVWATYMWRRLSLAATKTPLDLNQMTQIQK